MIEVDFYSRKGMKIFRNEGSTVKLWLSKTIRPFLNYGHPITVDEWACVKLMYKLGKFCLVSCSYLWPINKVILSEITVYCVDERQLSPTWLSCIIASSYSQSQN